jgi:osmoprotectant transport system permease protein
VVALTLFAIPPLLTNAYVGVRDVDRDVREAARGMGMTGLQLLRRIELPLALPLIAAGLRTAAVQVVATATLAAYVGGGGLGRFIADGFGQADPAMTAAGGVLVATLALVVELTLAAVQRRLTPGTRRRRVLPGLDAALVPPPA